MRKILIISITLLCALFIVSCDGSSPSAPEAKVYSVKVPQFLEGNDKASKAIDLSDLTSSDPNYVRIQLYEYFPPLTGFTTTSVAVGSKINTTILGTSLTVTMSLDSVGNYVFEGKNDNDYLKVVVAKDNNTFTFVHAISVQNITGFAMPVVIGEGTITDSGFEGDLDFYLFNAGTAISQKAHASIKKTGQ